jgi:enoyl-CoA hydratase/carnithine racemase
MADEQVLQVNEADGLARVAMNRPERLNALNQPLTEALLAYFESKRRDSDVRVIVLTGAGRAFSAGADLKAAGTPERLRDGPHGDWTLRDLMKAMRACPQPIIASVKGAAAGGGLAMALASDLIIAGESAAFHPAFSKIGLSGSELGVSWRLQRLIGASRARLMLYTGRPMKAQEALAAGLVSAVVADDALEAETKALAAELLAMAPDALRITKRTFDATLEAASFDTALEIEERGQIQMIRQNAAARREGG